MTAYNLPSYEFWLTNDYGLRLASLSTGVELEASRVVNGIGSFSLKMPLSFDDSLIIKDRMFQLWRKPRGGTMKLWRVYFVRWWKFSNKGGKDYVEFGGPDINDLLRRRIVAEYTASARAEKTDYADDMMKEIVTQALDDAGTITPDAGTRVWANLDVQGDFSLGPSVTKGFSFEHLLTSSNTGILPTLSQMSINEGTPIYFDIVPYVIGENNISFQFQTYLNQPGQDVSSSIVFSTDRGTLKDPVYEEDWTEEENYIYAAGRGENDGRVVEQVYDADRYNTSQWARCEGACDARNEETDAGTAAAGQRQLEVGRGIIRFSGIPIDTDATSFGKDWDVGYKVQAKYHNRQFYSIIWAVALKITPGGETIGARIDYESTI